MDIENEGFVKEEVIYFPTLPLYKDKEGKIYGFYCINRPEDVLGLDVYIGEKLSSFSPTGTSPIGLSLDYLNTHLGEHTNNLLHHKYALTNLVPQVGEITLKNSKNYPFNDSETVITLKTPTETTDYRVEIEVLSGENIGTINVTDKQLNGFKVAFTGSCTEAKLKYFVIGGY